MRRWCHCRVPSRLHGCDPFTFHWAIQRENADANLGASLNFDEFNDLVEVTDIYGESLAGERNRQMSELPGGCSNALQSGDINETVNSQTEIEEIQEELRTALSVNSEVARTRNSNAYNMKITAEPM